MAEEILVSVGQGSIDSTPLGYKKLIGFYLSCTVYNNCQVSLDFEGIRWIDGNMCALFTAILHKLHKERGTTFYVNRKNYSHIKSELGLILRNGFLQDIVKTPYSQSSVILTVFGIAEDEKFLRYIEHDLLENSAMKIEPSQKKEIVDNFLEVFSNVEIHARTKDPIFACGQYFPKTGKLNFTLVDLGIGYLAPIEEYTKGEITVAEKAIEWALKDKNTTKQDATGGTGLKNLLKYCKETEGELSIITGDAFWNNGLKTEATPFCGTTIHLIFNCKS